LQFCKSNQSQSMFLIRRSISCLNGIQSCLTNGSAINTNKRLFHITAARQGLEEFFDERYTWGEREIKTGRPWRVEELRIKSNSDLHKLWYVLYKERNMLFTMKEACKDAGEVFPNPERIDKVQESMKNIENVVRERNKAYWELEVAQGETGDRKAVFRKDIFGRYVVHHCDQHLIPKRLNKSWKELHGPGYGAGVDEFLLWYKWRQRKTKKYVLLKQAHEARYLKQRFPNLSWDYLQEVFPEAPIKNIPDNEVYKLAPKPKETQWDHQELFNFTKSDDT